MLINVIIFFFQFTPVAVFYLNPGWRIWKSFHEFFTMSIVSRSFKKDLYSSFAANNLLFNTRCCCIMNVLWMYTGDWFPFFWIEYLLACYLSSWLNKRIFIFLQADSILCIMLLKFLCSHLETVFCSFSNWNNLVFYDLSVYEYLY